MFFFGKVGTPGVPCQFGDDIQLSQDSPILSMGTS